ncbi:MAG: hypothetical protein AB1635_17840 [Acidobacteriota bacterium]
MTWVTHIAGTVGLALVWAIQFAAMGILIGVASILLPWLPWERFFDVFDAPLPAMGVPGVVAGFIFAGVRGVARRGRALRHVSYPRAAAWGAVTGVLLSLVPDTMVLLGLATLADPRGGPVVGMTVVPVTLIALSTVAACGWLTLARWRSGRRL